MDSITFTDPVFEAYRVLIDYGCVQNELLLDKTQRNDSAQVFPVIDSRENQLKVGDTVHIAVSANQGVGNAR